MLLCSRSKRVPANLITESIPSKHVLNIFYICLLRGVELSVNLDHYILTTDLTMLISMVQTTVMSNGAWSRPFVGRIKNKTGAGAGSV